LNIYSKGYQPRKSRIVKGKLLLAPNLITSTEKTKSIIRKSKAGSSYVAVRARYIIEVLGNGPMDLESMVLKMHLMLELHRTNVTQGLLPFFDLGQMLPFEVLG
jgi:hypothetical protein